MRTAYGDFSEEKIFTYFGGFCLEAKWFLPKVQESFGSEMALGKVLQRLVCLSLIFAEAPSEKRLKICCLVFDNKLFVNLAQCDAANFCLLNMSN